jgi:hypothetical protein
MTNHRLGYCSPVGLVLELDKFNTENGGPYFEMEVETLPGEAAMRDEYVAFLFRMLGIPIVPTTGARRHYPSKLYRALIDSNLEPLTEEAKASIVLVEEALRG